MWISVQIWILCVATTTIIAWEEHSVKEYGAVGDGKTNDTEAVRKAMQVAKDANGGRVIFDAGYTFLTGPFNISSNVILDIRGTIKGSPLYEDYYGTAQDPWFLDWYPTQSHSLIMANNSRNITITGGGLINGVAENWFYNCSFVGPFTLKLLFTNDSTIENITLYNCPRWTLVLGYATNIHIRNVNITNNVGDDAISIKSGVGAPADKYGRPSENITVRNMTIYMAGGIGAGNEIRAGIRNVTFEDIDMIGTVRGIFTRADQGAKGFIDGMTFRNIRMKNVNTTVVVSIDGYNTTYQTNPLFNNILLENITNDQSGVISTWLNNPDFYLHGHPNQPINNLTIKNIKITNSKSGKVDYGFCSNVTGSCANVFPFCPCLGPAPTWSYYNGTNFFYSFVTEYKGFTDAENYCNQYGGHLTSIHSAYENNYVLSLVSQTVNEYPSVLVSPNYWIGFHSTDNATFQWTDNSNTSYSNWAPAAPNYSFHPCAYANSDRTDNVHYSLWDDYTDCSSTFPFVCKTAKVPIQQWAYYNETNAYYMIVTDTKNYSDAEKYCAQSGGHLSSILSAEENSFVTNLVSNAFTSYATTWTYWIGLYTTDNETFQWSDSSASAYTNWAPYAPYFSVHPCAYIAADSHDTQHYSHWDDYYDCSSLFPSVCKMVSNEA